MFRLGQNASIFFRLLTCCERYVVLIICTMSKCQPKSFNQSNCLQVPSKLCTGHNIECWYHRRSKPETKYCHKMINLSVSSCSLNQSDDKQVKDEFHQPLPKCDGNDNSIVPKWKFIFSQQNTVRAPL